MQHLVYKNTTYFMTIHSLNPLEMDVSNLLASRPVCGRKLLPFRYLIFDTFFRYFNGCLKAWLEVIRIMKCCRHSESHLPTSSSRVKIRIWCLTRTRRMWLSFSGALIGDKCAEMSGRSANATMIWADRTMASKGLMREPPSPPLFIGFSPEFSISIARFPSQMATFH